MAKEQLKKFNLSESPTLDEIKKLSDGNLYSACVQVFGKDKIGPIVGW